MGIKRIIKRFQMGKLVVLDRIYGDIGNEFEGVLKKKSDLLKSIQAILPPSSSF